MRAVQIRERKAIRLRPRSAAPRVGDVSETLRYGVFTAVDGSLLDAVTFDPGPARSMIRRLRAHGVPLVPMTVMTLEEIAPIAAELELSGTMDGQKPDGNRVGRISMAGAVTEFPIPSPTGSPINIAVGPDRNIWYTKGNVVGRVTPEGAITELTLPSNGATGLTAGSDRQPPARLTNRLWIAMSAANALAYLEFN